MHILKTRQLALERDPIIRNRRAKVEIYAYGVHAFCARNRAIRRLKRSHTPTYHGFRIWPSSWLLMDFLTHRGIPRDSHVLDIGCGWGLCGIYCAKNHHATVTGVDIDSEVFPYLRLHAQINNVEIHTMEKRLEEITVGQLKAFNILIGADICFWDTMVGPLVGLINRALEAGIQSVFITDPGRPTFRLFAQYFVKSGDGEIGNRAVKVPQDFKGQILSIG